MQANLPYLKVLLNAKGDGHLLWYCFLNQCKYCSPALVCLRPQVQWWCQAFTCFYLSTQPYWSMSTMKQVVACLHQPAPQYDCFHVLHFCCGPGPVWRAALMVLCSPLQLRAVNWPNFKLRSVWPRGHCFSPIPLTGCQFPPALGPLLPRRAAPWAANAPYHLSHPTFSSSFECSASILLPQYKWGLPSTHPAQFADGLVQCLHCLTLRLPRQACACSLFHWVPGAWRIGKFSNSWGMIEWPKRVKAKQILK